MLHGGNQRRKFWSSKEEESPARIESERRPRGSGNVLVILQNSAEFESDVFSLSVSEMGTLICLGAMESWEFSRKTAKAKSNGIEVRKVLKVEPLLDATSHSFSLSVYKKPANMEEIEENIYLPITRAQLAVLRSIFNYIVPYLLGWNAFASTIKAEVYSQMNSANPRYSANNEWSR
ncbi:hypothetical protein LR48_Vigan10g285500 [Vigna angularis]|uniref:Uncharacterized protein n=1 Tax=Phaseolus angularis TaxID=3914 RepID=A0A0L9VPV5_PHAAN|nr:hypothetical protein LR48_Vigan10g285500 [Vigna angularis]